MLQLCAFNVILLLCKVRERPSETIIQAVFLGWISALLWTSSGLQLRQYCKSSKKLRDFYPTAHTNFPDKAKESSKKEN